MVAVGHAVEMDVGEAKRVVEVADGDVKALDFGGSERGREGIVLDAVELVVVEAEGGVEEADGGVEAINPVGRGWGWASVGIALGAVEFVVGEVDGLVEVADGGVVAGHVVEDGVPNFFTIDFDLVYGGFEIGCACGLLVD